MGEELAAVEKNRGGRPAETGAGGEPVSEPTLAELGVTKRESSTYQALAKPSPEQFETIVETVRETGGMSRPGTCLCAP